MVGSYDPKYPSGQVAGAEMSSPAGSTGTGTGSTANVFAPNYQPQADASIWQTLQPLINASAGGGAGTPAATAYPQATQAVTNFLTQSPFAPGAIQSAQQAAGIGQLGGQQIANATGNVLNTAFDPQSALFNRTQQQVIDQSNAANAMAGVAGTPYGAGVTGENLSNFDINWQAQQLANQQAGLNTATSAYPAAANLVSSSGGLPYSTGATIGSNALQGLNSQVNLGNNQYTLPQQTISDLLQYLGLGQSASQISGQLGLEGAQEEALGMQGIGSLFGGLGTLGLGGAALAGII